MTDSLQQKLTHDIKDLVSSDPRALDREFVASFGNDFVTSLKSDLPISGSTCRRIDYASGDICISYECSIASSPTLPFSLLLEFYFAINSAESPYLTATAFVDPRVCIEPPVVREHVSLQHRYFWYQMNLEDGQWTYKGWHNDEFGEHGKKYVRSH